MFANMLNDLIAEVEPNDYCMEAFNFPSSKPRAKTVSAREQLLHMPISLGTTVGHTGMNSPNKFFENSKSVIIYQETNESFEETQRSEPLVETDKN